MDGLGIGMAIARARANREGGEGGLGAGSVMQFKPIFLLVFDFQNQGQSGAIEDFDRGGIVLDGLGGNGRELQLVEGIGDQAIGDFLAIALPPAGFAETIGDFKFLPLIFEEGAGADEVMGLGGYGPYPCFISGGVIAGDDRRQIAGALGGRLGCAGGPAHHLGAALEGLEGGQIGRRQGPDAEPAGLENWLVYQLLLVRS